jgi:hypothetical protein
MACAAVVLKLVTTFHAALPLVMSSRAARVQARIKGVVMQAEVGTV